MTRRSLRFREWHHRDFPHKTRPPGYGKFTSIDTMSRNVIHIDVEGGKVWREYTCNGPSDWAWARLPQRKLSRLVSAGTPDKIEP